MKCTVVMALDQHIFKDLLQTAPSSKEVLHILNIGSYFLFVALTLTEASLFRSIHNRVVHFSTTFENANAPLERVSK
jgi:hypothetical protein